MAHRDYRLWRECLWVPQISGSGIHGAFAIWVQTNLADGDTIVLNDGTVTETWTARAASPGANEFLIGGDANATQVNFTAAVDAAGNFGAWIENDLNPAFEELGDSPSDTTIIYALAANRRSRVWGSAGSKVRLLDMDGTPDYSFGHGTAGNMPTANPGGSTYHSGYEAGTADLVQYEIHPFLVGWETSWAARWNANVTTWEPLNQLRTWNLTPANAELVGSNLATASTRGTHKTLEFSDAASDTAYWTLTSGPGYWGAAFNVTIGWCTTATAGNVVWEVTAEALSTTAAIDSDDWGTPVTGVATAPGTSGYVGYLEIGIDEAAFGTALAADRAWRIRIRRLGSDGADTLTAEAQFLSACVAESTPF